MRPEMPFALLLLLANLPAAEAHTLDFMDPVGDQDIFRPQLLGYPPAPYAPDVVEGWADLGNTTFRVGIRIASMNPLLIGAIGNRGETEFIFSFGTTQVGSSRGYLLIAHYRPANSTQWTYEAIGICRHPDRAGGCPWEGRFTYAIAGAVDAANATVQMTFPLWILDPTLDTTLMHFGAAVYQFWPLGPNLVTEDGAAPPTPVTLYVGHLLGSTGPAPMPWAKPAPNESGIFAAAAVLGAALAHRGRPKKPWG